MCCDPWEGSPIRGVHMRECECCFPAVLGGGFLVAAVEVPYVICRHASWNHARKSWTLMEAVSWYTCRNLVQVE